MSNPVQAQQQERHLLAEFDGMMRGQEPDFGATEKGAAENVSVEVAESFMNEMQDPQGQPVVLTLETLAGLCMTSFALGVEAQREFGDS